MYSDFIVGGEALLGSFLNAFSPEHVIVPDAVPDRFPALLDPKPELLHVRSKSLEHNIDIIDDGMSFRLTQNSLVVASWLVARLAAIVAIISISILLFKLKLIGVNKVLLSKIWRRAKHSTLTAFLSYSLMGTTA